MNQTETLMDAVGDPLGLSEYACQQADVVEKARPMEADRTSYAPVLDRLVAKGRFNRPQAEQARISFLQFAFLVAVTNQTVSPSGLGDEFWHEFLMDTPTYTDWCQRHFGRFLHHRPEPKESLEKRGVIQHSQALYRSYFDAERLLAHCANGHSSHGSCTVH